MLALPLEFTGQFLPLRLDLSRLILLAAVISLIFLAWQRQRTIVLPWYLSAALFLLYAVAGLISWLFTSAPGSSTEVLAIVFYPGVAILVMNLAKREVDHEVTWNAFLWSGLVVSAVGVVLYATRSSIWRPDLTGHGRVNATFADPDIMVRFAAMAVCAAILIYGTRSNNRWLAVATAIGGAMVAPLTLSRLGLVLFVGAILLAVALAADRRRALALSAVALIAFGSTTFISPDARDRLYTAVHAVIATGQAAAHPSTNSPGAASVPTMKRLTNYLPLDEERRYLIAAGLQMFVDHPIAGVGYGGFQHAFLTHYKYFQGKGYQDSLSHTSLVTILAEQGLIGFLLLLTFMAQFVREITMSGRRGRPAAVWSLLPAGLIAVIFVGSQVEARLFTEPYLWVFMGLIYSAYRIAGQHTVEEESPLVNRPLTVAILTHYYPPEVGAPQARLSELARRMTEQGVKVIVVTGMPNYPTGKIFDAYRGRWWMHEEIGGITVHRTWVIPAPNRGFLRRIVNHLSFAVSSLSAIEHLGPVDVIFVESPPLLIGLPALVYSWAARAPFIFNVSDIWPQSAVELGAIRNRFAIRLAEILEMSLYRRSARVTVVTQGILEKLVSRGVPREKLFLLTNAVDTATYTPKPPDRKLIDELGLNDGRKVFLYAGTHGMAQGLDVILDVAKLTTDSNILFLFAGEGADKEHLVARAKTEHIANVKFLPNQPRSVMPSLLNIAYATIVPLRRLDVFKAALPSKMFESMATGRPIVGAVEGEAAHLIETAKCGVVVRPEDPTALHEAVVSLAEDPERAKGLGANGRTYVVENFDRTVVAERFLEVLRESAAKRGPVKA